MAAASERPYHHGNLREALLDRAQGVIRERGAGALSLRELARDVGVSHAAPRRHFPDRQALLDALALAGFARLGTALRDAYEAGGGEIDATAGTAVADELVSRLRLIGSAYIAFASADPDLLDLMFAAKHGESPGAMEEAADAAFAPVLALILAGQDAGVLPAGDPERVGLGQLAAIHGIASLLAVGMVAPEQVDDLLEDSIERFLAGAVAPRG